MALGDRGDSVREEQKRLNALGADLEVDGIWGDLTEAASKKYGSADKGSTSANGSKLNLPGNAQLWRNESSGEWYVVYEVPSVEDSAGKATGVTYYSWLLPTDADVRAVVGPDNTPVATFSASEAEFTKRGVVNLGNVSEMRMDDLEGDPFDTWVEDMTTLAAVQPWILDADYQRMAVQAAMERVDGAVSLGEIQQTKWYKDHTPGERQWMETVHGDPAAAEQRLASNRATLRYRLSEAGINNATEALVTFMADRATTGKWDVGTLDSQINALADPYSVDVIDDDLFDFMANEGFKPDHIRTYESSVREHLREWLGPVFDTWTDQQVTDKAGTFRNDPDAEQAFIESLKDQRMALFPEHKDREASYEAIAAPWRMFSQNMWGQPVDDTDDVFQDVLRANNSRTASTLLRKAGLARGYDKTTNDVISGLKAATKSNVRGAV